MHAVFKKVATRGKNINGERKWKLEENLEVLTKKKKCMEVDIKEVITSDESDIKKMTFCIQSYS